MPGHLLATKLYIPSRRPELVSRPRLIEPLAQGLNSKLTLVSAPAGFGKTTLLSECIQQCDLQAAWVSLDEGDNNPTRFVSYLVAALQIIEPGAGVGVLDAMHASRPLDLELLLTGLVNDIAGIQRPFVIVLDDYHVISSGNIQDIILFILEHQPPQMHLVISTRADPPWPLARWRVSGEITELRTQDLRFTSGEAATLLNEVLGLGLLIDDIKALEARTEGWIAGLQMAAISLQGRRDVSGFIRSFTGSHRFVFDYLVEEVLDQQPANIQEFLLQTAILDRLCASLCDSLTGGGEAQRILAQLDQKNLFVIPLDDQRLWYRYHHLFADLLRSRLQQSRPGELNRLHRLASAWYQEHGLLYEAVNHAFAAGDVARVAQLAEANVLGIMERGELGILLGWLENLPEELVNEYPWLVVARAWAITQAGVFDEAAVCLSTAEISLAKASGISNGQVDHIRGHIASIRCYIEILSVGDYEQAAQLACRALEYLPQADIRARGMATVLLAIAQRLLMQFDTALDTLNDALAIYRSVDQEYVIVDLHAQIARVRRDQGLLHAARDACQEALSAADRYAKGQFPWVPAVAYAMGILGRIYYEWNSLEDARETCAQALELSQKWGQANTLLGNQLLMARIYRAGGDYPNALRAVQEARQAGGGISHTHAFVIGVHEAAIRLEMRDMDAVARWVFEDSRRYTVVDDNRVWELAPLYMALFREKRIQSIDDLLSTLVRLQSSYEATGARDKLLKADILIALGQHAMGDVEGALSVLGRALSIGEAHGYGRSFIDHGAPMKELLRKAIGAGIAIQYAQKLLSVMGAEAEVLSTTLVEPLTERELDVLRLMATDLTVPEIADELVISVGTARTHVKHIYRKLDVHSRLGALTRAREMGLF